MTSWVVEQKPKRPVWAARRDAENAEKERIAAIHRDLREDFYRRTAPKWGITK